METTRRSIAKAVSYRVVGTLTKSLVVFIAIGRLDLAATDWVRPSRSTSVSKNSGRPSPPSASAWAFHC